MEMKLMSKGTVLVIDDEKDLIELVRYNLDKEGFDVVAASDGSSGLEIATRHRPNLVVLDLMMPGMDGLEVCRRMRGDERTRRIPVIMLTAKAAETDKIIGLEMGADDYITKPFSVRELLARVRAVLRRPGPREKFDDFAFGQLLSGERPGQAATVHVLHRKIRQAVLFPALVNADDVLVL